MKKRSGFTLIELMIVIAIIIILAAIAIPNYLNITKRARTSRVAGDFNTIATALEAYRTDWGNYPKVSSGEVFGRAGSGSTIEKELTGAGATVNASGKYTLTGEQGPLVYIESKAFQSFYNPFNPNATDKDVQYTYTSDATGTAYKLTFTSSDGKVYGRTNGQSDLTENPSLP